MPPGNGAIHGIAGAPAGAGVACAGLSVVRVALDRVPMLLDVCGEVGGPSGGALLSAGGAGDVEG
ncbi:MAG: hypothetical protein BGO26_00535 [Actinobacteria bacterium 69-20]|nr:MAG: hypothetical protein BGO26_00535 [Actinobacteria bacterium 69-20]